MSRLGESTGPRTRDKVHLSDIYKILMRRLQPKRFTNGPMDMKRIEIGLLFENMLERALAEKFGTVRPGEVVSDEGVYMSPDGVNPIEGALEEYKSTYMSCRGGITEDVEVDGVTYQVCRDKFIHWVFQIMGYLKWLGVNVCILRVLFICGDYSKPITPQFISYRLTFTDEEIETNWSMLMSVATEEGIL